MTTAILINAILAVAILAAIVGMKIWAIRTQHHDHTAAVKRGRSAHRHAPRAHTAHHERREVERRPGSSAVPAQS